ncbi:hypothetical protein [Paraburkholderia sp. JHI869]
MSDKLLFHSTTSLCTALRRVATIAPKLVRSNKALQQKKPLYR